MEDKIIDLVKKLLVTLINTIFNALEDVVNDFVIVKGDDIKYVYLVVLSTLPISLLLNIFGFTTFISVSESIIAIIMMTIITAVYFYSKKKIEELNIITWKEGTLYGITNKQFTTNGVQSNGECDGTDTSTEKDTVDKDRYN